MQIKGYEIIMNKKTLSAILKWGSLGAAALTAVLQTLAHLLSYDPNSNYFQIDAPLPYIAVAVAAVGALCGILCAALMPAPRNVAPFSDNVLTSLPAALGMLAFPIISASFTKGTIPMLASLALICAAAYSILCTTPLCKSAPTGLCLLGFGSVIAAALVNATFYFDTTLEMNAPAKVALQTALLFAMLYYTAELRYLLDRAKPRLFIALSLLTLSTGALSAIPMTVAFACGIIDRKDCFAGALLVLGIAITVLFRLIRVLSAKNDPAPIEEQFVFTASCESKEDEA